MSLILAIETATGPCSIALHSGDRLLASLREDRPMMQARRTVPMIEEVLRMADTTYGDLTHIVATSGPGSFTGARVGLGVARAVGFSTGKPVAGLSTLSVMAHAASEEVHEAGKPILCLLNAGRGEVYAKTITTCTIPKPLIEARVAYASKLAALLPPKGAIIAGFLPAAMEPLCADAARFHRSAVRGPEATALAGRAARLLAQGALPADDPVPFYIRPPDAKIPTGLS